MPACQWAALHQASSATICGHYRGREGPSVPICDYLWPIPPAAPQAKRASTNCFGSNGAKSEAFSPVPMNRTGTPSWSHTAKMTPPLAVPSSFASRIPVTPTASVKYFAWWRAFCPLVASSTSSTSCGAVASLRWMIRFTLRSSSIRWNFVCSRPAVSMITTSASRASPAWIASNTTAPGSAPCRCAITSTPPRPPPPVLGRAAPPRGSGGGARQHHPLPRLLVGVRQLADARRLPRPVHPHDQYDRRPLAARPLALRLDSCPLTLSLSKGQPPARTTHLRTAIPPQLPAVVPVHLQRGQQRPLQRLLRHRRVADPLCLDPLAQALKHLQRRLHAGVGRDQRLLQLLPQLVVQPPPEHPADPREPRPPRPLDRLLDGGGGLSGRPDAFGGLDGLCGRGGFGGRRGLCLGRLFALATEESHHTAR